MRTARLLRPGFLLVLVACSAENGAVPDVGPTLLAPKALLDRVDSVSISVYDATNGVAVSCDEATGVIGPHPGAPVATATLSRDNCESGHFCGAVSVPADGTLRTYAAVGLDAEGAVFAAGCTTSAPKANADLTISIHRQLAPATCGNGIIEAPETCDSANDPLCVACATSEFVVSTAATGVGPKAGTKLSRREPALFWRQGSGDSGRLWAAFGDTSVNSSVEAIGVRLLGDDARSVSAPTYAANSFFLPTMTGETPPAAPSKAIHRPAIAGLNTTTWIAFEDESVAANGRDIRLRSVGADLKAAKEVTINGDMGAGEPGDQTSPVVAASTSSLLVAWVDAATTAVFARTVTPGNGTPTLGAVRQISDGGTNQAVAVARTSNGWGVVWESGGDIKLRLLADSGLPSGAPVIVNAVTAGVQEKPVIAACADGSFAVAFTDKNGNTPDVYVQRYTAAAARIPGDLDASVATNTAGIQGDVALAAFADNKGYAVAWADGSAGTVRGRWLKKDAGTFLNPVDGTDNDFLISSSESRTRATPRIVTGGKDNGIFVAWVDTSSVGSTGILGRRLPAVGNK